MAYEKRELTGGIFPNEKREKESQPHGRGDCLVDGKEYWISAWTKASDKGTNWQSLAFTLKEVQPTPPVSNQSEPRGDFKDMDSDIPF